MPLIVKKRKKKCIYKRGYKFYRKKSVKKEKPEKK
jgi:hypothetical protein